MKDELKEILKEILDINLKLDSIKTIVININNNRLSKELQHLESQIILQKKMSVSQIMKMFSISRPWALRQMEKIAEQNLYFQFIKGDKRLQRESFIMYSEEKEAQDIFKKIFKLMEENEEVIFAKINELLSPFCAGDFERVKYWIYGFVDHNPEKYFIKEENKLCRKSVNS